MAKRDFWIEIDVEGRKNKFASGPRRRGGGIWGKIMVLHKGEPKILAYLECGTNTEGKKQLRIELDKFFTTSYSPNYLFWEEP